MIALTVIAVFIVVSIDWEQNMSHSNSWGLRLCYIAWQKGLCTCD